MKVSTVLALSSAFALASIAIPSAAETWCRGGRCGVVSGAVVAGAVIAGANSARNDDQFYRYGGTANSYGYDAAYGDSRDNARAPGPYDDAGHGYGYYNVTCGAYYTSDHQAGGNC